MGIVDDELAAFELPAYGQCQIEADVNGNVHLHLGAIRIEFSREEYIEFAAVVRTGQERLHAVKSAGEEAMPTQGEQLVDAL